MLTSPPFGALQGRSRNLLTSCPQKSLVGSASIVQNGPERSRSSIRHTPFKMGTNWPVKSATRTKLTLNGCSRAALYGWPVPRAIRKQALRRDRDVHPFRSVRRNRLPLDKRVLAPKRRAGMGRSQIDTLVVLEARLLSCDGALRNWRLAPDAANPSFAWFRNDLSV